MVIAIRAIFVLHPGQQPNTAEATGGDLDFPDRETGPFSYTNSQTEAALSGRSGREVHRQSQHEHSDGAESEHGIGDPVGSPVDVGREVLVVHAFSRG